MKVFERFYCGDFFYVLTSEGYYSPTENINQVLFSNVYWFGSFILYHSFKNHVFSNGDRYLIEYFKKIVNKEGIINHTQNTDYSVYEKYL